MPNNTFREEMKDESRSILVKHGLTGLRFEMCLEDVDNLIDFAIHDSQRRLVEKLVGGIENMPRFNFQGVPMKEGCAVDIREVISLINQTLK